MNLLENSVLLTTSNDVQDICRPLNNYFDISYFGYVKTYIDSSHLALSTSAEWMKCFYKNFHKTAIIHKTIDSYESGEFLWSQFSDSASVREAQNQFDIAHGIMMVRKSLNFCEFFGFATNKSNTQIENWYLRNIDLFDRFILYFKETANSLIDQAKSDRSILPNQLKVSETLVSNISDLRSRLAFLSDISLKNTYGLSNRQLECVYYLAKGKTLKEIAKTLNLSAKTIEHYLIIAKTKLKCSNRAELIDLVLSWRLHSV